MVARLSGAGTGGRPLQYVRQLVQPALECLRRELALRSQLGSRERDLGIRERDLSLMLEMSSNQTATGDGDEFDLILKTGLEHMGCALAALWVPDKNIALSMTRSGNPMSKDSLQRAQQHLMAWMQLQQRTIVINHISKVASDERNSGVVRAQFVQQPTNGADNFEVLFFATTDVVGFSDPAVREHGTNRAAVILHVKPVANVLAIPIDRERLVGAGIQDHERNQFGKLGKARNCWSSWW